jgi:excisionase family DNA binding protein
MVRRLLNEVSEAALLVRERCAGGFGKPVSIIGGGVPEALSPQQTCEVGGFGKSTFYRLINEGLLPAKKLGKKTLVLRSDLLAFLNSLPNITDVDGPPPARDTRSPRPSPASGERAALSHRSSLSCAPPVRQRKE